MEFNGINTGAKAQNRTAANAIKVITATKMTKNVDFRMVREFIKKAATMPLVKEGPQIPVVPVQ